MLKLAQRQGLKQSSDTKACNGQNRVLHSHFCGVQSNLEATGNVFNHFQDPSIDFNRNNLKIQIKILERNIEKNLAVLLPFFNPKF